MIEARAQALAAQAVTAGAAWVRRLGEQPADPHDRDRWLRAASTVAAYRDRWNVTEDLPLGGSATTDAQRNERQRAQRALREANELTAAGHPLSRRVAPPIRAVSAL